MEADKVISPTLLSPLLLSLSYLFSNIGFLIAGVFLIPSPSPYPSPFYVLHTG